MANEKSFMKMDDKYSVSIVMPTFNRKDIVSKHIYQLLNEQNYNRNKYELIVVDDGSSDGTYDHLTSKFKKEIIEGRLKVLKQNNHGLSQARNLGLSYAKGNYICRMDDDDPPLSNRLEDSINYFIQNPNKRLVHAKSYWIDKEGKKLNNNKTFVNGLNRNRERIAKYGNLNNTTEDKLLKKHNKKYVANINVIHGGTTMAHRSLYQDVKNKYGHIYDPVVVNSEDKDLWVRIAKLIKEQNKGSQIGFLDKIVANYTYGLDQESKEIAKRGKKKYIDGYLNSKLNSD